MNENSRGAKFVYNYDVIMINYVDGNDVIMM